MREYGDGFTRPAERALFLARDEAEGLGHGWLGTEHLLLGLLREEEGVAGEVLRAGGLDLGHARQRTIELVGPVDGAEDPGPSSDGPRPTPRADRLLRRAQPEAWRSGAAKAGTAHLLLALLGDPDGLAYRMLSETHIGTDGIETEVRCMVEGGRNDGITAEELREEAERLRAATDALNEATGKSLWRMILPGLASALTMGAAVGLGVYVAIRLARGREATARRPPRFTWRQGSR